ncbi:pyocin knob domain-containing protein [Priestia aryabhattai]|uniref:pyocin knob domain-containing protein n=1 Tax=Priestia megaterium TaxID=1404 RepID=UPI003F957BA0
MTVKKGKYNFHNGTGFDTYHLETQPSQVKVLDANGNVTSNLEELLLTGKSVTGVALSTVNTTGLYMVKDCTDAPITMASGTAYLMSVETTGMIVKQVFYDRQNNNTYTRPIYNGTAGSWIATGKATSDSISNLQSIVGSLASLTTSNKTSIVNSINEVQSEVNSASSAIVQIQADIASLDADSTNHNHDSRYLQLTGGSLTGKTSMKNNTSYAGKNTSGADLNVGKVDGSNQVVLGDVGAKAVVQASAGDLKVSNGTTSYKVFHAGNMGAGSGLDADKLDGLDGGAYARQDAYNNHFQGDQFIENSKSIVIKASSGSSQAGNLFFRAGDDTQKAKITATANGDLTMTGGTVTGHTFKSDGILESVYSHHHDATSREVHKRFVKDGDNGIGFFMNTSGQFGMHDWKSGQRVMNVDRASGEVEFVKAIKINGKKVTVQSVAPPNPENGDIWFDI